MRPTVRAAIVSAVLAIAPLSASLGEEQQVEVTLQGDTFTPAEIRVPASQPVALRFVNKESAPVEIEAKDLKIEKVVPPGGSVVARVKPLKPGRYLVVNEYREDVAKAYVVAE